MQSFASMYLKIPHTAARYYGDLRNRAEDEVFTASHHPAYFYTAAYAYCKLDHFFRSGQIDRKFKPARYHLLAGVRTWYTASRAVDSIESKEKGRSAILRGLTGSYGMMAIFSTPFIEWPALSRKPPDIPLPATLEEIASRRTHFWNECLRFALRKTIPTTNSAGV